MEKRNIIVIGASAGGFNAIKLLMKGLPSNLEASIFIVWHMASNVTGILPKVINNEKTITAVHPEDNEKIAVGRVYVAPPDHHMIIDGTHIRLTRGPKENRFRPAVDPLFRSAAYHYGPRVIGVILSGALDDGSAGLWAIKQFGGLAVVQDPNDAEVSSMPENAMRAVAVDYKVSVADMAALLEKLVKEEVVNAKEETTEFERLKIKTEIKIAMEDKGLENNIIDLGTLTPYTCPECHGVLAQFQEGERIRFRCHTGHALSSDTLLTSISERLEENIWSAIRSMHETVMLLNHMGDHFAELNQPKLAAVYFKKAKEAETRIELLRQAVFTQEHLNEESLEVEAAKK
jgi:two-component system, chemotaxis family, protein-glutamate methylesterase/glutaminase